MVAIWMSKQLTAILIGLILLTLGGLVLVSNFVGEKNTSEGNSPTPGFSVTPKLVSSPYARSSSARNHVNEDLAAALSQLAEISEAAKSNDWPKARNIYDTFALKNKRLPLPELNEPHISPLWQDYFDLYNVQFERALQDKQPKALFIAGNQMRGILSEAQARLSGSALPMEVERMHFLIGELSLWKDLGDEKMVQARKIALTEAWSDVASLLRTKRGSESVSLEFSSQLTKIIAADNLQKLAESLPALTKEMARIDALFAPKPVQ